MLGKVSIAVKTFGVCDFSRLAVTDLALAALALVVFGAYDSYPTSKHFLKSMSWPGLIHSF